MLLISIFTKIIEKMKYKNKVQLLPVQQEKKNAAARTHRPFDPSEYK